MSELLPKKYEDFRSQSYWRTFFENRSSAFEWYGAFSNIDADLKEIIPSNNARILVPGAGNSELSEKMYNAGFHSIVNVDFDSGVMNQMAKKTAKSCPKMSWITADVKQMGFSTNEFDCIVDKGLLDAMFPTASTDSSVLDDVSGMLMECSRVLKSNGSHVIITLAQDHVMAYLLTVISRKEFLVKKMEVRTFYKSDIDSPLCPFIITLTKATKEERSSLSTVPIVMKIPGHFSSISKNVSNSGEVFTIQLGENDASSVDEVITNIHRIQWMYNVWRRINNIGSGSGLELDLWPSSDNLEGPISSVLPHGEHPLDAKAHAKPRYTVTLRDRPEDAAATNKSVAVLIIPQGRETEYSFSTADGQQSLLKQVSAARLIFVELNASHKHASMAAVKEDLSPLIIHLLPEQGPFSAKALKEQIPFLAVSGDDIGSRTVILEGKSGLSGEFTVEDIPWESSEEDEVKMKEEKAELERQRALAELEQEENTKKNKKGQKAKKNGHEVAKVDKKGPESVNAPTAHVSRRLVFASNRNALQSEALIALKSEGDVMVPELDYLQFCFPYHGAMASTIALHPLFPSFFDKYQDIAAKNNVPKTQSLTPLQFSSISRKLQVTILGLGGGTLASHIALAMPFCEVTAVELDPDIVSVAREQFLCPIRSSITLQQFQDGVSSGKGKEETFVPTSSIEHSMSKLSVGEVSTICNSKAIVNVVEGDALEYVHFLSQVVSQPRNEANSWAIPDVIIVDVDAKDMQVGLSFPPVPFLSKKFLSECKEVLSFSTNGNLGSSVEMGALVVNVGARNKPLMNGCLAAVRRELGTTLVLPTDTEAGDLNCVVIAGGVRVPKNSLYAARGLYSAVLSGSCSIVKTPASEVVEYAQMWLQKVKNIADFQ